MLWTEERTTPCQKGFSLIELLVAITILAIGLMAAASMQGTAVNANMLANRNTVATAIAQQVMDDLLSAHIQRNPPNFWYTRFTPLAATTFDYDRFPPYDGETNNTPSTTYVVNGVGMFRARYTIIPNTPTPNISQIQVNVFFGPNNAHVPLTFPGFRLIPAT